MRESPSVRDYEAVDSRGRRIAGPSKSYSDMKRAAGTGGHVKYVRPEVAAPRGGAQAAGQRYAEQQIKSTHFDDWVRDQLIEASKMPPEDVIPLETPEDARKIARRMLQQLEWDAKRDSRDVDIPEGQEEVFWRGFHKYCMDAVPWLADELLTLNREMRGAAEARPRPKAKRSARKKRR